MISIRGEGAAAPQATGAHVATERRATVADPARRRLDVVLVHLVRLVLDDGWSAPAAAGRLIDLVDGDPAVLRGVRARVLRGTGAPAGRYGERALATLDLALCCGRTTTR